MKNLLKTFLTLRYSVKTIILVLLSSILAIGAVLKSDKVEEKENITNTASQDYYQEPSELTIASPDVAALGKFGFLPVNKYTGNASIDVPIYSIPFDGMNIPVGLSYNSGGIPVMEEASWVGLGWTLSANAVITRRINYLDDLETGFGYPFMSDIPADIFDPTVDDATKATLRDNYFLANPHTSYGGKRDAEPDIFVANLFGKSFKFYLKKILMK